VSFTLTPMMSARLLRGHVPEAADGTEAASRRGFYHRLDHGYARVLGWAMAHRGAVAVGRGHEAIFSTIYAGSTVDLQVEMARSVAPGVVVAYERNTGTNTALRKAGIEVYERTLTPKDILEADEIFSSGNFGKLMPVTQVEDRPLQPGPIFRRARELYWEFAHGG